MDLWLKPAVRVPGSPALSGLLASAPDAWEALGPVSKEEAGKCRSVTHTAGSPSRLQPPQETTSTAACPHRAVGEDAEPVAPAPAGRHGVNGTCRDPRPCAGSCPQGGEHAQEPRGCILGLQLGGPNRARARQGPATHHTVRRR